jgi:hypothetical protein
VTSLVWKIKKPRTVSDRVTGIGAGLYELPRTPCLRSLHTVEVRRNLANEIQPEASRRGKRRARIRSLTLIITYRSTIGCAVGHYVRHGTYFL